MSSNVPVALAGLATVTMANAMSAVAMLAVLQITIADRLCLRLVTGRIQERKGGKARNTRYA